MNKLTRDGSTTKSSLLAFKFPYQLLNQSEISTGIFEETADGFLEGVKDDLELLKGTYEELMAIAEDEGHKEIANYAQDQILDLAKSIWMLNSTLS